MLGVHNVWDWVLRQHCLHHHAEQPVQLLQHELRLPRGQICGAVQLHGGPDVRGVQYVMQGRVLHEWRVLRDGPVGHDILRRVLAAGDLPGEHVHASGPVSWEWRGRRAVPL